LRVLQQQFTVAALSCQTSNPSDPTFASRYNRFIERFAPQLQDNSEILYHHFGRGSSDLDRWITRIANDAGQKIITTADFCQVAWNRIDLMITLSPAEMQAYAAKTEVAGDFATLCSEQTSVAGKKKPPSK
jgi:hypothetical protein